MAAGDDVFRLAQHHAKLASDAIEAGELVEADLRSRLADTYARLALAAAQVLAASPDGSDSFRRYVGGGSL